MKKPNLKQQVLQYMRANPGRHFVCDIADGIGVTGTQDAWRVGHVLGLMLLRGEVQANEDLGVRFRRYYL